jgi:hypothetical protein
MTGFWVGFILFLVLVAAWLWDKFVTPRRATRPPVLKIMELIQDGKTFTVYDNLSAADRKACPMADYVVMDNERKVKTYFFWEVFHEVAMVEGDLDWMNQHEKDRVFKVVSGICSARFRAWRKASDLEKAARDDKRRDEAKKIYESR